MAHWESHIYESRVGSPFVVALYKNDLHLNKK